MIKEFITTSMQETVIKIQGNEINAIRSKDITKKGVRVYEDGFIGISGAIGDLDDATLVEQAKDNLKAQIPYPYEPTKAQQDHRVLLGKEFTPSMLKSLTDDVLKMLTEEYPEFTFSHMISYRENNMKMRNTEGLDLSFRDGFFDISLVLKEKSSANLMDGFVGFTGRNFDLEKFLTFNRSYLNAYKETAELPVGERIPVFTFALPEDFIAKQLNGEKYATGSSIYSKKLGEKLFNDQLNISYTCDSKYTFQPFFDMEGTVVEGNKVPLIKDGKFVAVCADKKTAADYELPHTGGASGEYDSRPNLGHFNLHVDSIGSDIKKALNGQKAIFVLFNAGGDFTPDGSYASPVQVSFLFDGEKLIGKLPECNIRSHINKMFGDDYIGSFDAPNLYFGDDVQLHGFYMTVTK